MAQPHLENAPDSLDLQMVKREPQSYGDGPVFVLKASSGSSPITISESILIKCEPNVNYSTESFEEQPHFSAVNDEFTKNHIAEPSASFGRGAVSADEPIYSADADVEIIKLNEAAADSAYKCQVCERSYSSSSDLVRHEKYRDCGKSLYCSVCNKQFAWKSHLIQHMECHDSETYSNGNPGSAKSQKKSKTEVRYECTICMKQFSGNYGLKKHMEAHANYPCEEFPESYGSTSHSGTRTFYNCEFCAMRFSRIDHFTRHLKSHAPQETTTEQPSSSSAKQRRRASSSDTDGYSSEECVETDTVSKRITRSSRKARKLSLSAEEMEALLLIDEEPLALERNEPQSVLTSSEQLHPTNVQSDMDWNSAENTTMQISKGNNRSRKKFQKQAGSISAHKLEKALSRPSIPTEREDYSYHSSGEQTGATDLPDIHGNAAEAHNEETPVDKKNARSCRRSLSFFITDELDGQPAPPTSMKPHSVRPCELPRAIYSSDTDENSAVEYIEPIAIAKKNPRSCMKSRISSHEMNPQPADFTDKALQSDITPGEQILPNDLSDMENDSTGDNIESIPTLLRLDTARNTSQLPDYENPLPAYTEMESAVFGASQPTMYPPTYGAEPQVSVDKEMPANGNVEQQMSLPNAEEQTAKERRHKCHFCELRFVRKCDLKRHLKSHSRFKPYQCLVCYKRFLRKDILMQHSTIHSESLKCKFCSKEFLRKESLKKHVMTHLRSLECQYCKRHFSARLNLTIHLSRCGKRPHVCNICRKSFSHRYILTSHMIRHSNVKNHQCKTCLKFFSRKHSLTTHLTVHTDEKSHPCTICSKKFRLKKTLERHLTTHIKSHRCEQCLRLYSTEEKLTNHVSRCKGAPSSNLCRFCNKVFSTRDHLKRHVSSVHLGVKPFQCKFCLKFFTYPQQLERHLKGHILGLCRFCRKPFTLKKELAKHYAIAHPGKIVDISIENVENNSQLVGVSKETVAETSSQFIDNLPLNSRSVVMSEKNLVLPSDYYAAQQSQKNSQVTSETPSTVCFEKSAQPSFAYEAYDHSSPRPSFVFEAAAHSNETRENELIVSSDPTAESTVSFRKSPQPIFVFDATRANVISEMNPRSADMSEHFYTPNKENQQSSAISNIDFQSSFSPDERTQLMDHVTSNLFTVATSGVNPQFSFISDSNSESMDASEHLEVTDYFHTNLHAEVRPRFFAISGTNPQSLAASENNLEFGVNNYFHTNLQATSEVNPRFLKISDTNCETGAASEKRFQHTENFERNVQSIVTSENSSTVTSDTNDAKSAGTFEENSNPTVIFQSDSRSTVSSNNNTEHIIFYDKYLQSTSTYENNPPVAGTFEANSQSTAPSKGNADFIDISDNSQLSVIAETPLELVDEININQTVSNAGNANKPIIDNSIKKSIAESKCEICSKHFASAFILKMHMTSHLRPCQYCKKSYSAGLNLTSHMLQCGKRPNECPYCKKTFPERYRLTQHLKIHSNMKQCRFCRLMFPSELELKSHRSQCEKRGKYQCQICKRSCFDNHGLKTHLKIHSDNKLKKCRHCKKSFSTQTELDAHKSQCEKCRYKCNFCEKSFPEKYYLTRHLKSHTNVKLKKCKDCKQSFPTQLDLDTHKSQCEKRRHECKVCGKVYSEKCSLTHHEIIHSGVKSHQCEICKKLFYYRKNLISHLNVHTGEKPHSCEVCNTNFTSKQYLKKHLASHSRSHKCRYCNGLFSTPEKLTSHELRCGKKLHQCKYCHKILPTKFRLISHLNVHMRVRVQSTQCIVCKKRFASRVSLMKHSKHCNTVKSYSCTVCSQSFALKRKLNLHVQSSHSMENNPLVDMPMVAHKVEIRGRYKCNYCKKYFSRKGTLRKHLKFHSAESFQCTICKKLYYFRQSFLSHLNAYNGVPHYSCSKCPLTFLSTDELSLHSKAIHSEKKFVNCQFCKRSYAVGEKFVSHLWSCRYRTRECRFCHKTFLRGPDLTRHLESHVEMMPHQCQICGKRFCKEVSLQKHVKGHVSVTCNFCLKSFNLQRDLAKHYESAHPGKSSQ